MPNTALYAALLVPIYIVLAFRVIAVRRGDKISVGDGGSASLLRRIRVHANFAEYVPLALVVMALAESLKTGPAVLHSLGFILLLARLAHAVGMSPPKDIMILRVLGVVGTFAVLVIGAIACLMGALRIGVGG